MTTQWNRKSLWLAPLLLAGCGGAPSQPSRTSAAEVADDSDGDELALHSEGLVACPQGLNAFSQSVHPLVTANCAGCHDRREGRQNGPQFAVVDAAQSYDRILRYVNFDNLDASLFVVKGGNQHCSSYGINCGISYDQIKLQLKSWWDGGESQCLRKGKYITPGFTVPTDLPTRAIGFKALHWDLGTLRPDLQGATFELEAQIFAAPGDATKGAYRFRKPRLITGQGTYAVGNVRVLVNGKLDPLANGYSSIAKVVRPEALPSDATKPSQHPVLSSKGMLVVMDQAIGDQLAISFESVDDATPRSCRDLTMFQEQVLPVLAARNCYSCHGGGTESLPGRSPTKDRLSMAVTDAELCARFLERTDFDIAMNSPIVDYALRGMNDHPRIIPNLSEINPSWLGWIASERARAPLTYDVVKPIFDINCTGCHNDEITKGHLKLNTFPFRSDRLGTDQQVVVAKILDRLNSAQFPMPPTGALLPAEIAQIQQWKNDGLPVR